MIIALGTFFLSSFLSACPSGFFPETALEFPAISQTGISQEDYSSILNKVNGVYAPLVSAQGAQLTIEREWEDRRVNAYAKRPGPTDWRVTFTGGMARHPLMTRDAFTLVVCHELGHHLGGAPKWDDRLMSWGSVEGQADYYTTMKCTRRLWQHDDNSSAIQGKAIPQALRDGCVDAWKNGMGTDLCIRGGIAALELGALLASMNRPGSPYRRPPKIETPDTIGVTETSGTHPKPQCRVDTFYQGGICSASFEIEFDRIDERIGACHSAHQDTLGLRPSCWFRSI